MKQYLLIGLFLCGLLSCTSETSVRSERLAWGWKGRLKKATIYTYYNIAEKNGKWESLDTSAWTYQTKTSFDKGGFVEEREAFARTTEKGAHLAFRETFTPTRNGTEGIEFDESGSPVAQIQKTWEDDRHLRLIKKLKGSDAGLEELFALGENGMREEITRRYLPGDDESSTMRFFYNQSGDLVKMLISHSNPGNNVEMNYKIEAKDDRGNPTRVQVLNRQQGTTRKMLIVHMLEYY